MPRSVYVETFKIMEQQLTENGEDCNLCGNRPAKLKVTVTKLSTSEVLDKVDVCYTCMNKYGNDLELTVGKNED
jgi:hypothetical protein